MREELRQRLEKEYAEFVERCKNSTRDGECGYGLYERFTKEEIECSFATGTKLSEEKIAELLAYDGCLLDYLYEAFYKGEDVFAIALSEKLDDALSQMSAIRSF